MPSSLVPMSSSSASRRTSSLPTEEYGDARFVILYGKNSQQGAVEGRKRHPLKKGRRWMLVKMPFQVLMLLVAFVRSLRSVSLSGFLTLEFARLRIFLHTLPAYRLLRRRSTSFRHPRREAISRLVSLRRYSIPGRQGPRLVSSEASLPIDILLDLERRKQCQSILSQYSRHGSESFHYSLVVASFTKDSTSLPV
jgi:hypothetical protein